ncbi:MAG: hypothetical protein AUJ20_05710 [Comamonadaceae bacterium CG1_02_60_18]|nr:MAG: hypothetical protein AUJ20_05710 [Comamonadaceae bacterium CG1_02_60_18]PIQ51081.1 MAG: hypothetical protein COW02_16595 [Comamonadaceae bacterium CG12_big_fil_rev_8_21_14_0_65_59_15]
MQIEPVDWDNGAPRSQRFDDIYRNRYDALAQARSVFLQGCHLPERWQGRASFTLLETGFGLGLNFLTTWATWLTDPSRCAKLNYFAIEAYPVSADDLLHSVQALETCAAPHDPTVQQVQLLAQQLVTLWSTLQPGLNVWRPAHQPLALHLYIGDVHAMLACITEQVDAVYLDGFSPAANPQMWSEQTLAWVARLCHPGTHLASYTVAGAVRRRLTALGFAVERCPGLPPKRERLQARLN